MNPAAIAIQGLEQADAQLNAATAAIANVGTAAGGPNVVNLGSDMISLTSAQTLYEVNIATLKTADQMEQSLINLTA